MPELGIFVSFEFDKDNDLKNNFYQQAERLTQHRIRNCSLNESYPDWHWREKAKAAIRECEVMVILVGEDTHNAPGVETEVEFARSMDKPIFQIVPRRRSYTGVSGIDTIRWKWTLINEKLDEL